MSRCTEAANRPRKEYVPKKSFTSSTRELHNDEGVSGDSLTLSSLKFAGIQNRLKVQSDNKSLRNF